ncbi:MAG: alpha/beta hydrolase, partial [Bifidobacteriaceae bacterium]|nr:alpha/beta hydrolase [Bifidobacteriaceae bacterium]
MNSRKRRHLSAAAMAASAALILSACAFPDYAYDKNWGGGVGDGPTASASGDQPTGRATGDVTASPNPPSSDEVVWEPCPDVSGDAECATIHPPLDYANPDGETIDLALARIPASDQDNRIGSLLINPGGPGGSGIDMVDYLSTTISAEVLARYDLLGFDPRGVGRSSAVECFTTTEERDQFWAADWPRTAEGYEESAAIVQPFVDACLENTGDLLAHVDTISSARDMDFIRQAVGDEELYYLGYSYGTQLGATYAELFPDKVGRLVLDGALDLSLSPEEHSLSQAAGFQQATETYVDDCLSDPASCPLTGPRDNALTQIHDLLAQIHEEPLPTMLGRDLTLPLALNGVLVVMYEDSLWPYLTMALEEAMAGDGTTLLILSDLYMDRDTTNDVYTSNTQEAFIAINALDASTAYDLASVEANAAALKEAAPTFGEWWGYGEKLAELWPYPAVDEPHAPSAPGAKPILVIGTTGDPATPYHEAVTMSEQLESGVLLTYEGEGHTAYGRSNDCI